MIVVDTSAVLAILLDEPDKRRFEEQPAEGTRKLMSAVNAHEAAIVLRLRQGIAAVEKLWAFLSENAIEVVAFDEAQVRAAVAAYGRYGKGIDPRARLNLCDCAAYALAETMSAPILFKGDDFSHTDLASAL